MKLLPRLTGNRILALVLLLLAAGILLLRYLSVSVPDAASAGWKETLPGRITKLGEEARAVFEEKQTQLQEIHYRLAKDLRDSLLKNSGTAASYLKTIAAQDEQGICYELFDRDTMLIAWREDTPIQEAEIRTILGNKGKTFFIRSPLIIYLAILDEIRSGDQRLFLITATPLEARFAEGASEALFNLPAYIEKKFRTECRIDYLAVTDSAIDGRYFRLPLLNNQRQVIGSMQLKKPSPTQEVEELRSRYEALEYLGILIAYVLLMYLIMRFLKRKQSSLLDILCFLLLLTGLRWLMFKLNVPVYYFPEELRAPEYFASKFGGGIVKSPAEFLLSLLVLFIGCTYIYQKYITFLRKNEPFKMQHKAVVFSLTLPVLLFTILLLFRGYAASVKSVIFDSSLRYFNEPSIVPRSPHLVMNIGAFLLGLSTFMAALMLLGLQVRCLKGLDRKIRRNGVIILSVSMLAAAYLFITFQHEPLFTAPQLLIALALMVCSFLVTHRTNLPTAFLIPLIGFFSSISVVMLMTVFNGKLELESLKTTAAELRRPKPEFTQFIITDILNQACQNSEVIAAMRTNDESLSALAFLQWNKSALVDEHIPAYIGFVSRTGEVLGEFEGGIQRSPSLIEDYVSPDVRDVLVDAEENDDKEIEGIVGIAPVREGARILGYCFVEVSLMESVSASGLSSSLQQKKQSATPVLPFENLSMAKIINGKVVYAAGDLLYGEDLLPSILSGSFNETNELRFNYSMGNERYIVFAQRTMNENGTEIVSAALKEKDIEWSLFNFFKLFIIHTIILLTAYLVLGGFRISRQKTLSIPFRSQLMAAFVTVSVLPVIALAFYNHFNIEDKSTQAIRSSLTNQLLLVEKHLRLKVKEGATVDEAIEQCGREMGIHFSVYRGNRLLFASRWNLYEAGVLPDRLPLQADLRLNYMAGKEYFSTEETTLLTSLAFYREITLKSPEPLILCVNSAFNYVAGSFSPVENDVFIFGIYSFAIFFIIAVSSLLAERIARPIKRLTLATQSVAKGDLNISLENHERGELRELIQGFNIMTNELHRAQAEIANFERESAWKDFARQVAHEIKNPLTPMKLTMQHLIAVYRDKSPNFDAAFEKITTSILNQIETLNSIASEFSRFARMPGALESKIDLLEVLQETITLFESERIAIRLEANGLTTAPASGDAAQLRRAFINFIRNAIEARAKTIVFSLSEEGNEFLLRIADDGTGVPDTIEQNIFEKSFTTKKSGMGLGLSIAKRSIENAGGTLRLENGNAPGAIFLITYPKKAQ